MKPNRCLLIIPLLVLFFNSVTFAQRTCGSELNLSAIQKNDPDRYYRIMQMEQEISKYSEKGTMNTMSNHVITIPVVVHVLHTGQAIGTGLNISEAQIQSQIDVLNEDFRRLNANATNTPAVFQGVAADSEIEFVLACVDPNGNPTNGIIRVQTNVNIFYQNTNDIKFTNLGGSTGWPSDRYLNIWVAGLIHDNLNQELLGYAQFPDMMATHPLARVAK